MGVRTEDELTDTNTDAIIVMGKDSAGLY